MIIDCGFAQIPEFSRISLPSDELVVEPQKLKLDFQDQIFDETEDTSPDLL